MSSLIFSEIKPNFLWKIKMLSVAVVINTLRVNYLTMCDSADPDLTWVYTVYSSLSVLLHGVKSYYSISTEKAL